MTKDPQLFIEHILESISFIEKYIKGMTLKTFMADQEKQDSVVRRLEIIGEAVKKCQRASHQNTRTFRGNKWPECEMSLSTTILELTSFRFGILQRRRYPN